ncbi:unnamed protein product [Protopolystoma xenopodis]|uniref:Uncharacterized protein n=1 Tax=Protopolystoma xenopodis TaxID=117903 RepID=A0A448WNV1_9PLAT|nr:unnamed protein product [Protopolystoma xenopodis]
MQNREAFQKIGFRKTTINRSYEEENEPELEETAVMLGGEAATQELAGETADGEEIAEAIFDDLEPVMPILRHLSLPRLQTHHSVILFLSPTQPALVRNQRCENATLPLFHARIL